MKRNRSKARLIAGLFGLNLSLLAGPMADARAQDQQGDGVCGYCIAGEIIFACCQVTTCSANCCHSTSQCH